MKKYEMPVIEMVNLADDILTVVGSGDIEFPEVPLFANSNTFFANSNTFRGDGDFS